MKYLPLFLLMVVVLSNLGCKSKQTNTQLEDDITSTSQAQTEGRIFYENSVKGHNEERLIVGNFTGYGIDTLYVVGVDNEEAEDDFEKVIYYAKSNNPDIPSIELSAHAYYMPRLVFEGDVDGDGKDDWGYLTTWDSSQWRYYYIFNYDNRTKRWRYLYSDKKGSDEPLLNTSEILRSSGVDIVEKGPRTGYIKIKYTSFDANFDLRDTIVKATYTPIQKDS